MKATITATQSVCPPLTEEQKERFVSYFKGKYPLTKSIILNRRHACLYARVRYRGENPNRKFFVWARSYEMLVMKTQMRYQYRDIPPVHYR